MSWRQAAETILTRGVLAASFLAGTAELGGIVPLQVVQPAIAETRAMPVATASVLGSPPAPTVQAGPSSLSEILQEIRSRVIQRYNHRLQVSPKQIDDFLYGRKGMPYTVEKRLYWDLFDIVFIALKPERVKEKIDAIQHKDDRFVLPKAERVRFFMWYWHIGGHDPIFLTWSAIFDLPKVYYNGRLLNKDIILTPLSDPEREGVDGRSYMKGDRAWIGGFPPASIPPSWNGQIQKYLNGEDPLPAYMARIEKFLRDHRGK